MQLTYLLPIALLTLTTASPISLAGLGLYNRGSSVVNPNAISGIVCTDPSTKLVFHDVNVATLGICGGIAGAITKCQGAPTSTSATSGTAKFSLVPETSGATINVSKGRWEGCIRAAEAVCGLSPFKATCKGGASVGDLSMTLSKA